MPTTQKSDAAEAKAPTPPAVDTSTPSNEPTGQASPTTTPVAGTLNVDELAELRRELAELKSAQADTDARVKADAEPVEDKPLWVSGVLRRFGDLVLVEVGHAGSSSICIPATSFVVVAKDDLEKVDARDLPAAIG